MKVLLVTNQYVDIRNGECFSDSGLYGTLHNMKELGNLHIVAGKIMPDKQTSLPVICKLDFIDPKDVSHFLPLNRKLSNFFKNRKCNKLLLEQLIPTYDLIVGYMPSFDAAMAWKIARKYNKPFLSFLVGCPWDTLSNHHRFLARVTAPFVFLETRKVILNSDYVHYVTRKFLQQRYPTNGYALGCSDTNLGKSDYQALNSRLSRIQIKDKSEKIVLVTTANVDVRYKGHEYVIRALKKLKDKGDSRYVYWLMGAGKGTYLRNLAHGLDLDNQVVFLGRKSADEVKEILRSADVYLQPSLQEGLPRSVVEAMSQALPCIGFITGGIPELLDKNFLVKRRDVNGIVHCLELLEDKEIYAAVAERNFNIAAEYEHTKLTKRIRDFFSEVRRKVEEKI